jgi:predicted NACHT family NTPase
LDLRGVAEETFADAAHAEKCVRGSKADLEIRLTNAFRQCEARGRRGMVVLGDPGSGKTTHMKLLLLWCLRNGPETLGLPAEMLPVFLPLRELKNLDQGLDAFIQDQLASPHLKTPEGFGERLLDRGNLLFLLDGLDEVADLSRREQVAGWVMKALRAYPTCRFVLTCRFAGYSPTVRLSEDFLEMHVRPLTSDQVEGFVHNWYRIVETGLAKDPEQAEGIAAEKADSLVARLREPDFRARRVFELTRNPLLLTNICLVHRHRGALPRKRARLYEECIDVLMEHWREASNSRLICEAPKIGECGM